MKIFCLILSGLLLLCCPAGAATIASTTLPAVQDGVSPGLPMRATDLFTVGEIAEIFHPGRLLQTSHLSGHGPDEAKDDMETSQQGAELPVGFVQSLNCEFAVDQQVCKHSKKTDEIVAVAAIALN